MRIKFIRSGLAILIFFLAITYIFAWSPPDPGIIPSSNNTDAPINKSNANQVKDGDLEIKGVLSAFKLFASGQLGVGFNLPNFPTRAIDILTVDHGNPRAVLDVGGQIRIHDNCGTGTGQVDCTGKVFKSTTPGGFASWQSNTVGITKLIEGFGIDLADDSGNYGGVAEITSSGIVAASTTQVQRLVNSYNGVIQNGCSTPGAVRAIDQTGNATCQQNFVTTAQAPSGTSGLILTNTTSGLTTTSATSGPISFAVNVGPATGGASGLSVTSNTLLLNVIIASGDGGGLTIDSNNLLKFEPCGNGQTWKYDPSTKKWGCADLPGAPGGESVIYLKSLGEYTTTYPDNCPAGWSTIPAGSSGATYTSDEVVGNNKFNKVRTCYRTDMSCQVMYLGQQLNNLNNLVMVNCPTNWISTAEYPQHLADGTDDLLIPPYTTHACYICN